MVPASDPVTVKLYAHRRLYEPRSGRYVTFDDLAVLSRRGMVQVLDAGTGADIADFLLSHLPTEH